MLTSVCRAWKSKKGFVVGKLEALQESVVNNKSEEVRNPSIVFMHIHIHTRCMQISAFKAILLSFCWKEFKGEVPCFRRNANWRIS